MEIKVNGGIHPIQEDHTLEHLVNALGLERKGVAIAINREIVPREQWPKQILQPQDQVEIVQAIGGG